MRVHNTKLFLYRDEDNTFISEISNLGGRNVFYQVFPNRPTLGFALASHKTGHAAVFYVAHEEREAENYIQFWRLLPTEETIRKFPKLATVKVIVFND